MVFVKPPGFNTKLYVPGTVGVIVKDPSLPPKQEVLVLEGTAVKPAPALTVCVKVPVHPKASV